MIRHGKILICVLSGLVAGPGAKAVVPGSNGNPYQRIVERNVFNIHSQEVPKELPPIIQLQKITLAGVTTILGPKMAILNFPGNKQGQAAESHILAEGQRDGDIEVLEINEQAGVVRISNSGTPQTLDFVNNGMKPPTLPAQTNPTAAATLPYAVPTQPQQQPQPGQPVPPQPTAVPQPANPQQAVIDAAALQAAASEPAAPQPAAPTTIPQPQRPQRAPLQSHPAPQ